MDYKTIPFTMTATAEHCQKLIKWFQCVNAFPFHGHERGTVQIGMADAVPNGNGTWNVTGELRQNDAGFSVGTIVHPNGRLETVGHPNHVDFAELPFVLEKEPA